MGSRAHGHQAVRTVAVRTSTMVLKSLALPSGHFGSMSTWDLWLQEPCINPHKVSTIFKVLVACAIIRLCSGPTCLADRHKRVLAKNGAKGSHGSVPITVDML
eukprot:6470676-Amphidinium_carterae.1